MRPDPFSMLRKNGKVTSEVDATMSVGRVVTRLASPHNGVQGTIAFAVDRRLRESME